MVPVEIQDRILSVNDRQAAHNREHFAAHGVLAINLMGSPGSGKTAVLEATARAFAGRFRVAAIAGDLATDRDAERLRSGGHPGARHHHRARRAISTRRWSITPLHDASLQDARLLFVENVGNLVCPAVYDLGQAFNVVALAVTEGEDKPLKYPVMFRKADLVLVTKTDLLPHLDVRAEAIDEALGRVMPRPDLIHVSARNGDGLQRWFAWLEAQISARGGPVPGHPASGHRHD